MEGESLPSRFPECNRFLKRKNDVAASGAARGLRRGIVGVTISNPNSSVLVQGNGVSTSFTYNFLIPDATDAVITLIDAATSASVTLSQAQFTLTGAGNPLGGTFVYPITGSAITSGFFLNLERVLPLVQNVSIRNQGTFYPAAVEGALDYLTMVTQQLQAQIDALETDGAISPNADAIIYTPQYFGAIVNGVADDGAAFVAAKASGFPIFVPVGNYLTTLSKAAGQFPQRMWGDGQVEGQYLGSPANPARFFSQVSSRPATSSDYGSPLFFFNGDYEHVPFPVEHWITGASTLGQPDGPYLETPECYPHVTYLYNSSGWNQTTTGSDGGRTAAIAFKTTVYQDGQGDAIGYNSAFFVHGTKPGATNTLANPNATCFNGGGTIGSDGASGTGAEIHIDGGVYDNSAMGFLIQLTRGDATGANYAWWEAFRCQSNGAAPIDTFFQGVGGARFGLDLSFGDFSSNSEAAITLENDQRFYWDVTATDPSGISRYPSALGEVWQTYNSALSAMEFVVGNVSTLKIFDSQVNVTGPLAASGELRTTGDSGTGLAGNICFTGTSNTTTNSTGVGSIKFKGATSRDSLGFVKGYVGTTPVYIPIFSAITG